jgi:ABC-2 type transport system permease protein
LEDGCDKMSLTIKNTLLVAEREFLNLLNSRLVLIIMALYFIEFISFVFVVIYPFNGIPPIISNTKNPAHYISCMMAYSLCWFGSIVAVVLGFTSISEELDRNALNTLIVKPLYRDTIINGKMLGTLVFAICLFLLTISLYIMFILVYYGLIVSSSLMLLVTYISSFSGHLPLVLVLTLLCFFFFYALSILYALLFKNQSFALFMGIFSWIILFCILGSYAFSSMIGTFFNDVSLGKMIGGLSIYTILYYILGNYDLGSALRNCGQEFFTLSLYCFISLISAYVVFLKRDIS